MFVLMAIQSLWLAWTI